MTYIVSFLFCIFVIMLCYEGKWDKWFTGLLITSVVPYANTYLVIVISFLTIFEFVNKWRKN